MIKVDADKVLMERDQNLVGANIEDLNCQLYGGLYSQLLYGEAFEEHVDPTELFGLKGSQRFAVWVLLDEKGQPFLSHFSGRGPLPIRRQAPTPRDARPSGQGQDVKIAGLTFNGGVIFPGELSPDQSNRLIALATGDAQVSRHWRKVQTGSASGRFLLVRDGVFTGKQAQQIQFLSGEGEVGVDNAGPFRTGINLRAGKIYEGLLRIESDSAQTILVSLRNGQGKVIDQKSLSLAARPGEYQRIEFVMKPEIAAANGRFCIALQKPGTITLDYAFLQAGEWGRYQGQFVRKEFAEAMLRMGVATGRYNGSMVNKCPDGAELYRWKKMIGPRDERPPYRGFFNPYASHGFSVFDWMDFCEEAKIWPLFGVHAEETEQDMADLVEFSMGGSDTTWGARRIAQGHPKPYFLKAVQISNEAPPSAEYFARVRALATALWSKNRNLEVVLSVNVGPLQRDDEFVRFARWVEAQGQAKHIVLDSHYGSRVNHADSDLPDAVGLELHRRLAKEVPGFNLRLWPMEENGNQCTWGRGLAHAHNLNTLNRMPLCVERAGTANTFQIWDIPVIWDQGRIHFTPTRLFFQPSYYVDRMFADEWLPLVLSAQCESTAIDVLAKKSRDGRILALYIANLSEQSLETSLQLNGFEVQAAQASRIGTLSLSAKNTPQAPNAVVARKVDVDWNPARPRIELPPYSFTLLRLSR